MVFTPDDGHEMLVVLVPCISNGAVTQSRELHLQKRPCCPHSLGPLPSKRACHWQIEGNWWWLPLCLEHLCPPSCSSAWHCLAEKPSPMTSYWRSFCEAIVLGTQSLSSLVAQYGKSLTCLPPQSTICLPQTWWGLPTPRLLAIENQWFSLCLVPL